VKSNKKLTYIPIIFLLSHKVQQGLKKQYLGTDNAKSVYQRESGGVK